MYVFEVEAIIHYEITLLLLRKKSRAEVHTRINIHRENKREKKIVFIRQFTKKFESLILFIYV